MSDLEIVIGNKVYSSWSLRGWLAVKLSGRSFREVRLPLYTSLWEERIGGLSPSGKVPVLRDGAIVVWDSLAICEYLAETYAGSVGWPKDPAARAFARSVACEMHSGFAHIREEMPFNCRMEVTGVTFSDAALLEAERAKAIWRDCRKRFGASQGDRVPWLFGEFSIADIAFIPLAMRFATYGIPAVGAEADYIAAVKAHPAVREWCEAAAEEAEVIPQYELGKR